MHWRYLFEWGLDFIARSFEPGEQTVPVVEQSGNRQDRKRGRIDRERGACGVEPLAVGAPK